MAATPESPSISSVRAARESAAGAARLYLIPYSLQQQRIGCSRETEYHVREPLALHQDVAVKSACSKLLVAGTDRFENSGVFPRRRQQAVSRTKLAITMTVHLRRDCLLHHHCNCRFSFQG